LPVFNIERRHVPSMDLSCLVKLRFVTEQEPAIPAVLTQRPNLIFEWYGLSEGDPACFAKPFHILRVKKMNAKVFFQHIFRSETGVIQDSLIAVQRRSIGGHHSDHGWDGTEN